MISSAANAKPLPQVTKRGGSPDPLTLPPEKPNSSPQAGQDGHASTALGVTEDRPATSPQSSCQSLVTAAALLQQPTIKNAMLSAF